MLTAIYRIGLQHRVTTVEIPKHFPQPFTGLLPPVGLPGWAGTKRNIHPLTLILIIRHPLSTFSIYYDP